jgi:hypothetical protein
MEYKKIILSLVFLLVNTFLLQAQNLSKTEEKAIKVELRNYLKSPEKYKYLKESIEVKEVIVKEQQNEITSMTKERKKLIYQLDAARDSIGFYETKITTQSVPKTNSINCKEDAGMKYRLQIGLYEQFDITSFLEQIKVVSFEQVDGKFRYTIGNFNTEEEAEMFKEAVRRMGIKDAFVSYYLDGIRIPK